MEMQDAQGLELAPPSDITYLHGGYGEMFEALERALEGREPGESGRAQLEPADAFGEDDANLLRVEPLQRYGPGLAPGMQVEPDDNIYTLTGKARGQEVLDAQHP